MNNECQAPIILRSYKHDGYRGCAFYCGVRDLAPVGGDGPHLDCPVIVVQCLVVPETKYEPVQEPLKSPTGMSMVAWNRPSDVTTTCPLAAGGVKVVTVVPSVTVIC